MKTLIIVDFQKDFTHKTGSLYVKGSEQAEERIIKHIQESEDIDEVIFTVDWHKPKHCSFKENGGIWPLHCIQWTEGAGISDNIMKVCIEKGLPIQVFTKGVDIEEEEYGAFVELDKVSPELWGHEYLANNAASTSPVVIKNLDVEVCGVALDYCVFNTITNLIQAKDLNITLLQDCSPCIGDKEDTLKKISDLGVKIQ